MAHGVDHDLGAARLLEPVLVSVRARGGRIDAPQQQAAGVAGAARVEPCDRAAVHVVERDLAGHVADAVGHHFAGAEPAEEAQREAAGDLGARACVVGVPDRRRPMQIVTALAVATLIGGPLLALNPLLSWEPIGERPLLNLLLLVYGLPALLLAALGYALEPSADRRLASVLQGLSGAVGLFFISLEIRQLFHGAVLVLGDIGLAELSCMIIAWLLIAFGLFRLAVGERSAQRQIMARVVAGLAVVALVLGSLLYANPLLGIQDVGAWPLLNWLVPAYAVPALLVAMLSRGLQDPKRPWLALALASLALVLGFAFVTLELRQWFQGSRLDDGSVGSAENYAYSVVWILYGVALLVAGILRGGATLRWASLVVVLLAVGKVFLLDAAVLTGLYRVASFFGLGVSLMVIGYVYQRVVFGHPAGPTPAVSPPPMRS